MSFRHWLVQLAAVTTAVFAAGCTVTFSASPPAQLEAGVLIGDDGTPYMGLAACGALQVTTLKLWYDPVELPQGTKSNRPPAIVYEFDPPVPRGKALGILDPNGKIEGGKITEFNQAEFDCAMHTSQATTTRESANAVYPRAYVTVDFRWPDGDRDGAGSNWYADLNKPGTWNKQRQMDADALKWKCDGEPAWDFSVVDG